MYLYQIILFFFFSLPLFSQSNEELKNIVDNKCKSIKECIFTYDSSEIDIFDCSTEGGFLKAYFKNNSFVLLKLDLFYELGKVHKEFYFDNDEIIFVLEQNFFYNRPIFYDEQTAKENNDNEFFDLNKTTINELKYYFNCNEIVDIVEDNKIREINDKKEKIRLFKELNCEVDEIKQLLKMNK